MKRAFLIVALAAILNVTLAVLGIAGAIWLVVTVLRALKVIH